AGNHGHAAFDGDELVATVIAREYSSHFAGAEIATCGIAAVTVKAEHRGRGLLADLFQAAFAAALARGEVISTLFPTAPRIYRKFGYELVGERCTVEIPSSALANIAVPQGIRVRRATAFDFAAIERVYHTWASGQHGPLTRSGPNFTTTADEFIGEFNGVTVAVDFAGQVVGFVSWDRGQGYDSAATLRVSDLIALTPVAAQALWSVIGSFTSVTGQVRVDTSGDDLARLVLPGLAWRVVKSDPYMLAVIDVASAFSQRSAPPAVTAALGFSVIGHPIQDQNGDYQVTVSGGAIACRRGGSGGPTFTAQGLALRYAGTQSCGNLRLAGQLAGGNADEDSTWDAVFGGHQFHIRDYF
ncbi:MAG: GNAT family N-acetyltransferase, partial [Actinomycetota bacterium]|nr:GNAT family N-acetyltransferase [Actinomycetota bacterium]